MPVSRAALVRNLWLFLALCASAALVCAATPRFRPSVPQDPSSFEPASVPVYVGELELHAVVKPGVPRPEAKATALPPGSVPAKLVLPDDPDSPSLQAQAIVTTLQNNVLQALVKLGYNAQPTPGDSRPENGVEIRGVFAEPDEQNRIRRAILGAGSTSPTLLLYVGVANLSKPEQPFYDRVIPNSTVPEAVDVRYGPVISISAYAPAAKFELDRNPTSEDLNKLAKSIAAQIDSLLRANPLAVIPQ
jgi:Domain of unknown function (DUF4410)